jgi:hypothetical protein
MTEMEHAWRVPLRVEDIAEDGRHIELSADDATRAAIAAMAGLRALPRLEAAFDVTRRGAGLRVVGEVSATVGQTCVVTLDAIENEIREPVDLVFAPTPAGLPPEAGDSAFAGPGTKEPPEPLVDGAVDLAAVTTEFLILGIDPYPRKPGAIFGSASIGEEATHPFAALAKLKQKPSPDRG